MSLEERAVPAVITVTSPADFALGTSHSGVTLRDAIQAAVTDTSVNGSTAGTGADNTIEFASSLDGGRITLLQGQVRRSTSPAFPSS